MKSIDIILVCLMICIVCSKDNHPMQPESYYIPNKNEMYYITDRNTELASLLVDTNGDKLSLYAEKNNDGTVKKLNGVSYSNIKGENICISISEDGLPHEGHIGNIEINFINYTSNTVDLIIRSEEEIYTYRQVPIDSRLLSELRESFNKGIYQPQLASIESQTGLTEINDISPEFYRNAAQYIRFGSLALNAFVCTVGIVNAPHTLGLTLVAAANSCTSLALNLASTLTENEFIDELATAWSLTKCMNLNDCIGLGLRATAEGFEAHADQLENSSKIVSGNVVLATNGSAVIGATVSLGSQNTVTDDKGYFVLSDVSQGSYEITVTKQGYITDKRRISVNAPISLIIALTDTELLNKWRAVLVWTGGIKDVDLHASKTNGEHVYWSNMTTSTMELDRDDRDFFGPETITIDDLNSQVAIYVHNYSSFKGDLTASELAASGAAVTIYHGNQTINTYNVPVSGSTLWWHVCRITTNGVVDLNRYGNNPFITNLSGNEFKK